MHTRVHILRSVAKTTGILTGLLAVSLGSSVALAHFGPRIGLAALADRPRAAAYVPLRSSTTLLAHALRHPRVHAAPRAGSSPPARAHASPRPRPLARPAPVYTREQTQLLRLASGPFPGTTAANALVYVPAGLDRARPLSVVVFIHGWHGCAPVVAGSVDAPCTPGDSLRNPLDLIDQMRAAHAAAVLIVPQMAFDRQSSDPGLFAQPDGFRHFLAEVLDRLAPVVGRHGVDGLARVVLASHSAGYVTVVNVLARGGVALDEVAMFDSLYDRGDDVAGWILARAERFDSTAARPLRFVSLYREGAPASESRALGRTLTAAFAARGRPRGVVYLRDDEARRLTPDEARAPIVLARVNGDHADAARRNFTAVLRGAGLNNW